MDFSDQIALGRPAGRRAAARSARLERAKFRVVLLDEYQDTSVAQALMLSRLFSGPDPATAVATRSARSATPTRRSTAGVARRCPTSSASATTSRPPTGGPTCRRYPLSVNRRSDARILEAANDLAAPLYAQFTVGARAGAASRDAEPGTVRVAVHETYDEELAWLPEQVRRAPTRAMETPSWREIGVLTRDNAHAADVFDALTRAEIPVEIVGPPGPAAAARGRRGGRHADPAARPDRQRRAAHPAHRPALGRSAPRDLALLGRRARR